MAITQALKDPHQHGTVPAILYGLLALGVWLIGFPARADPPSPTVPDPGSFALHGQFTYLEQETSTFTAPYAGPNSLSPGIGRETTDATLYLGLRPWSATELWLNTEVDQGSGLDDTLGVAGFTSGEAYKVGRNRPYFRLPRAFVRQTMDLGGEPQAATATANEFGAPHSADRLVFTAGKFSVTDVFDNNQYAHDPRADFMNWTAIDAGSFDYAADAWGYTVGAAAEWYQGRWTLRAGVFDLSNVPNSPHLDPGMHEFQGVLELERRYEFAGQPGKAMITAFDSRGRMGLLDQAVQRAQLDAEPVDIAAVRTYRSRLGVDLNIQQQLSTDLGAFLRIGKAAGNVEAYEFTDIDRSIALGLSLTGGGWRRAADTVGFAALQNGSSAARQRFLNAGGLGILVGDGRLPRPGPEQILETYYSASLSSYAQLTFDYQWVANPAYNRDRGPASVFSLRVHLQI